MRKVAEVAEQLLASKRVAVTGESRSAADHGANARGQSPCGPGRG